MVRKYNTGRFVLQNETMYFWLVLLFYDFVSICSATLLYGVYFFLALYDVGPERKVGRRMAEVIYFDGFYGQDGHETNNVMIDLRVVLWGYLIRVDCSAIRSFSCIRTEFCRYFLIS